MSFSEFIIVSLIDSLCHYEGLSVYKQICKSINNCFCSFEECWFNFLLTQNEVVQVYYISVCRVRGGRICLYVSSSCYQIHFLAAT